MVLVFGNTIYIGVESRGAPGAGAPPVFTVTSLFSLT